jgi:hypothetical protein
MPSNRPKRISQRPVIVNNTPCDRALRALSRQAAQKCVGKSMSRHRDLPRATLSSSTPLQSPRKDILRQHFAKNHYADPERPTPSSRTPSSRTIYPVIPSVPPRRPELVSGSLSNYPDILNDPPRHPELDSGSVLHKPRVRNDGINEPRFLVKP